MAAPEPAPSLDLSALADPETWRAWRQAARDWLGDELTSVDVAVQAGALVLAALAGWLAARALSAGVRSLGTRTSALKLAPNLPRQIARLAPPLMLLFAFLAAQSGLDAAGQATTLVRIAVSLAAAWAIIRFATHFIRDPFLARAAALAAWTGALLNIFGLLGPAVAMLDAVGFTVSGTRVSLWIVLRAFVVVTLLLAFASWLSTVLRHRINALPSIEPSLKILFGSTVQVALVAIAIVLGLGALGIDLAALAIFGGAVGLGLGFGLQKIVANFISGIILLLDRSIKPGDVIEVADSYGWVNSLGLRYASIVTRDGHEHLIPNELLMTEKVVNWSYTFKTIRVRRSIGVAYGTDIDKAIAVVIEAATAAPRTVSDPAPKCLLIGFGDSSVDLEVRFWIDDPQNGVAAAAHEVLLNIWRAFKENGIEIPFPQRDVHIKDVAGAGAGTTARVAPDEADDERA